MGMFSWECKGCGGELCEPEIALVRMPNGITWGPYDGYGRAGMFDAGDTNTEPAMWHKYCYDRATPENQNDITPSEYARNQGFGTPQRKFC